MKKYYERYWDERKEMGDFKIKWKSLKANLPLGEGIKFLDFGCGKGLLLSEILKINPDLEVVGADVSKTGVNFARKAIPSAKFVVLNEGEKLPFKANSFDFILAADVLEHVYDTDLIFSELVRILKPGGKIFISVPYHGMIKNIAVMFVGFDFYFNPKQPHIRFYTKNNLFNLVKEKGLKIIKNGYYGRFYPISHGMFVLAEKSLH